MLTAVNRHLNGFPTARLPPRRGTTIHTSLRQPMTPFYCWIRFQFTLNKNSIAHNSYITNAQFNKNRHMPYRLPQPVKHFDPWKRFGIRPPLPQRHSLHRPAPCQYLSHRSIIERHRIINHFELCNCSNVTSVF